MIQISINFLYNITFLIKYKTIIKKSRVISSNITKQYNFVIFDEITLRQMSHWGSRGLLDWSQRSAANGRYGWDSCNLWEDAESIRWVLYGNIRLMPTSSSTWVSLLKLVLSSICTTKASSAIGTERILGWISLDAWSRQVLTARRSIPTTLATASKFLSRNRAEPTTLCSIAEPLLCAIWTCKTVYPSNSELLSGGFSIIILYHLFLKFFLIS